MARIHFGAEDQDTTPPRLRPPLWLWGWLGLLAFLVFELTAEPALSFTVFCLRFAWEDLLTARWLRRSDAWRDRSSLCRWFLLARGSARVSLAAFSVCLFWGVVSAFNRNPQAGAARVQPMPAWIPAVALVLLAGLLGTGLFGALGVWRSRRTRLPVWLDPVLHQCAAERRWPPALNEFGTRNLIDTPWLILLAVWLTTLLITALIAGLATEKWFRVAGWPAAPVGSAVVGLGLIGGGVVLMAWAMNGVRAHQPGECWRRSPAESNRS